MSNLGNLSARADRAAQLLRIGGEAGPLIDEIWRDLHSATIAELEGARGVVVHSMNLLGRRGARITSWMVEHSFDHAEACPSERYAFWTDVQRNVAGVTAAA